MAKHIPAIIAINPGEIKVIVDGKEHFALRVVAMQMLKKKALCLY